jgi:hypothetical protein
MAAGARPNDILDSRYGTNGKVATIRANFEAISASLIERKCCFRRDRKLLRELMRQESPMRKSIVPIVAATVAVFVAARVTPAVGETPKIVKIGDLSKEGYACKGVGENRHVCTRDKTDPTYGCDKDECQILIKAGGGQSPSRGIQQIPGGGLLNQSPGLMPQGPGPSGVGRATPAAPAGPSLR